MDYKEYYLNQAGSGLPVFHGSRYQKGYGLGSIFKSFFKWVAPIFKTHAVPLLKSGAKTIGTEAVRTAANVATDTLAGRNLESSLKERAQEAVENLSSKAKLAMQQTGNGHDEFFQLKSRKRKKNKVRKNKNKKINIHKNVLNLSWTFLPFHLHKPVRKQLKLLNTRPLDKLHPLEFKIVGVHGEYLDFSQTYLYLKAKIKFCM